MVPTTKTSHLTLKDAWPASKKQQLNKYLRRKWICSPPSIKLDDLDITGFLHKESIFPKLPLFTPNKHFFWYGTNPGKGNSKRHLILSDTIIVTVLTICMRFRFLNCRILKNTTFLGMGCRSWEWGAMHFAHGSSDLENLKLDIEGEGNHKEAHESSREPRQEK